MNYILQQNDSNHLIVLFHGTGGDERQMLPIAGELFPGADVISFAGAHGEGYARRYFPPLTNGVMDRNAFNTAVASFIETWNELALSYERVTLLGYSNGANFIIGLLEKGLPVDEAYLLHPSDLKYDLSGRHEATHIYMTMGMHDFMVSTEQAAQLEQQFKQYFNDVNIIYLDSGHEISMHEIETLKTTV